MMHRRVNFTLPVFSVVLSLFLPLARGWAAEPLDVKTVLAIDSIVEAAMNGGPAAGVAVAISRGNEIVLAKAWGLADVEWDAKADPETLYRIGSVTKQFTAAAIMKLAEQGKLNIDDDITKHLTGYPTGGKAISVKQLLNHTSGIPGYTEIPDFFAKFAPIAASPSALPAFWKDKSLEFEPGTKWKYSNSGYHLLGLIIEKVSGKPYGSYLQDEFFTPLGLSHTRMDSDTEIIPHRARGYEVGSNGKLANADYLSMTVPYSAGALLSTPSDLCRWTIALHSGRVVSPQSFAAMIAPTPLPNDSPKAYGFGLGLDEQDGQRRIAHGGGINGFNSDLAYFPSQQVAIAVISNGGVASGRLSKALARAVMNISPPQAKDLNVPESLRAALCGTYDFPEVGLSLVITSEDGRLMAQGTGQPKWRMLFQGGLEFAALFDSEVRVVAAAPAEGGPVNALTIHQGGMTFTGKRKAGAPGKP